MSGEGPTRVVVAGGGFGGIYATLYLSQDDPGADDLDVLLLSQDTHFTFTPLLHDVLGGSLDGKHVAAPYRVLAARRGFRFRQARVEGVDPDAGRLETTAGPVDFDYLILALGATPFRPFADVGGNGGDLAVSAFHRIPDATALHDRVLGIAETCARDADPGRRRRLLTFVVGGGGPAGVEAAGELLHLLHHELPRYYDGLEDARVVLAHGGERILAGWDEALVEEGQETLRRAGLDLRLDTRIESVSGGAVRMIGPDGEHEVGAATLVETLGTRPASSPLEGSGLPLDHDGYVRVDACLRVGGRERIFAVGDLNDLRHPRTGERYPDVAPIALSQGIRAAANVLADRGGWAVGEYGGDHAGKIVTLGGGKALVDVLGWSFGGRPAWWVNRVAYLLKLVGGRNKAEAAVTLLLNRLFERNLLAEESFV